MRIIVTGSIAYDYLMSFPGSFSEHLRFIGAVARNLDDHNAAADGRFAGQKDPRHGPTTELTLESVGAGERGLDVVP